MSELKVVLNILKQVEEIKGSNFKMETLKVYDSPLLRKVLEYALNPYKRYYITSFNMILPPIQNAFDSPDELFKTLDALTARTLSGHAAREDLEFITQKYFIPAELIHRIINKDLKCGLGVTSINKVFPKLIPEFNVALAEEYNPEQEFPTLASFKYDGVRCIIYIDDEGVTFKSRGGLDITSAEHLKPILHQEWKAFSYAPIMLDGELKDPNKKFEETSGDGRKKKAQAGGLELYLFDFMLLESFMSGKNLVAQEDRYHSLRTFGKYVPEEMKIHIVGHAKVYNDKEVQVLYKHARELGHEGLILKDPNAPYSFTRNNAWTKLKDRKTADVRVTGFKPGEGKYTGLVGSLIVDYKGKPNKTSGMSDQQRKDWTENPDLVLGKMVEVAYHEETKDGNLRHARFIDLRPDLE